MFVWNLRLLKANPLKNFLFIKCCAFQYQSNKMIVAGKN